jgi:MFS family permease
VTGAFSRLALARGLVIAAAEMAHTAIAYELYRAHRDPMVLGSLGLAQFLPIMVCALPAGAVADRHPRKTTVGWCIAALIAWTTVLQFIDQTHIGVMLIMATVFGVVRAFIGPSLSALTASIVPTGQAPRYAAMNSMVFCSAVVVGPAVAGSLLVMISAHQLFGITTALFTAGLLLLWSVRAPAQQRRGSASWQDALEGWRILRADALLLASVGLDFVAVFLGGVTALLPVFALDVMALGPQALGLMRAAPGVGALGMALWLSMRPLTRQQGSTLLWCVALFGVATIVFGLSSTFPVALACLAVLGAADMVSVVVRGTLLQTRVSNEQRGRVNAINSVFIGGSNELGEMESGMLARAIGPRAAVVAGGIGTIVVVALCAWRVRALRELDGETTPEPSR